MMMFCLILGKHLRAFITRRAMICQVTTTLTRRLHYTRLI